MADERALRYAGVPVRFPYVPYRAQNALMHSVVTAAENADHALLESPTGTGKSLALLCAVLAWQEDFAARMDRRREEQELAKLNVAPPPPLAKPAEQAAGRTENGSKSVPQEVARAEREQGAEESKATQNIEAGEGAGHITAGVGAVQVREASSEKPEKKIDTETGVKQNCGSARREHAVAGASMDTPKKKKSKKKKLRSSAKNEQVNAREGGDSDDDFEAPKKFRDVEWQRYASLKPPRKPRPEDDEPENAHLVELFHGVQGFQGERPLDSDSDEQDEEADGESSGLPTRVPRIFYATRTHNQVAQIILELRKTSYNPVMTVLASRNEYCVREEVRKLKNRNEICQGLVKNRQCLFFHNVNALAEEPELKGEVWDIEDLKNFGRKHRGCPYYASAAFYQEARIIFCPYSYVLDKTVREARGISIKGDIIMLDEAHNIESYARECSSYSSDVTVIRQVFDDLGDIVDERILGDPSSDLAMAAKDILHLFEKILKLVDYVLAFGLKQHFDWEYSLHEKEELYNLFMDHGVVKSCIDESAEAITLIRTIYDEKEENAEQAQRGDGSAGKESIADSGNGAASQAGNPYGFGWGTGTPGENSQSVTARTARKRKRRYSSQGPSADANEDVSLPKSVAQCLGVAHQLVTTLKFFWGSPDDYSLVLQRRVQDFRIVITLHLWCLNAAVSFAPVAELSRSIIVTSGTLSPLHSFAGELGTNFGLAKSMPHVINVRRQLHVAVAGRGPGNVLFDATYTGSSTFAFQDALCAAICDYCRIIPAGVLVFLPSYRLLHTLRGRWQSSGGLDKLTAVKGGVFFEPNRRGEDFDRVMKDYAAYSSSPEGAILFGVCRGKLSEGIDFKDEAARGVIVVGIPFPHSGDLEVLRKREWNNWARKERGRRNLMPGSVWYEVQAFRALNQALGRTIRHRYDYGAIVLVDHRFRNPDVLAQLPGWTRDSRPAKNLAHEKVLEGLRSFFAQVHDAVAEVAGVQGSSSSRAGECGT